MSTHCAPDISFNWAHAKNFQKFLKGVQTMFKTIASVLLVATLGSTAHAQVRKCLLPDGTVTYSDVLCTKDTAKQADVKLKPHSADTSPARAEVRKYALDKLIAQARQREPNRCKFSIETSVLADGKQLAEAATQECFSNLLAEQSGNPTQNEALERWFENHQLAEGRRSASVADQTPQGAESRRKSPQL